MDAVMKNLLLAITLLIAGGISAQVSFNAGGSVLKGFGSPKWFSGFHVGFEVPRDDALSIYGRLTHHFKRTADDSVFVTATAKDFNTIPYTVGLSALPSMNYTMIEGGTRYYLGNGFDFGFAAYGGAGFILAFNKVKVEYDNFDETLYEIDPNSRLDGAIFGAGISIGGGVKYSVPRVGTFYSDFNVGYMVLAQGSQQFVYSELYSNLMFTMNIGYRRDIVW
jgi:hypothetical protein